MSHRANNRLVNQIKLVISCPIKIKLILASSIENEKNLKRDCLIKKLVKFFRK
jgi:hypothetical protein